MSAHPRYAREEKVRLDVLRRFGYFSMESNGHLSEYLPWYRKRPFEIESLETGRLPGEAAVSGDVTLLKQAMLHDPLVGAVCNPEEVWQITDEMLVAQAQWLPQYKDAIPAAQARLAELEANGTRVQLRDWVGAARLPIGEK